jgi:hypothetical protein
MAGSHQIRRPGSCSTEAAHDEGVQQHGACQSDAEHLDDSLIAGDEGEEHDEHDRRRGGDHPPGRRKGHRGWRGSDTTPSSTPEGTDR